MNGKDQAGLCSFALIRFEFRKSEKKAFVFREQVRKPGHFTSKFRSIR